MAFSSLTYTADGTTVDYAVTFNYLDRSHIVVSVDKVRTTSVGSAYTFEFTSDTNVRVRTVVGSAPVPNGLEVLISRETPIDTPAVVFGGGASLSSENLNKNSEYLTFALQEATDANDAFTKLYLGAKSAAPTVDNAGDVLQVGSIYFDTTDNNPYYWTGSVWNKGDLAAITETFKNAAEAAQAAALASQNAASTSASNASTSESNAASSASAAATSATNASSSETNVASSASAAAASASSAGTSATNAASSASAAATSASNAASSASQASTSETNAAASASAASASQTAAASSETAAASSATTAEGHKDAAAASAVDAAASASQASSSTSWLNITNWSVRETVGGELIFAHSGVDRMKITSTGDLTVTGEITAFGSI